MKIKIEKNIPVPKINIPHYKLYPFQKMKIGDSMAFPVGNDFWNRVMAKVSTSARYFVLKHKKKWKFTTRKQGDVIRIWRIR